MGKASSGISIFSRIVVFAALVAGICACIYIAFQKTLSANESAMLGIVLTMLSVLASWLITHMYAESQYEEAIKEVKEEHRNNLRTYALKASEKVNNLSNELNRLSIYLEEELNYVDYHSSEEELMAKEERIESAIHLIRSLKSVNDTSLSDWEGIIGDELDQRREEQERKEEEVKGLIQQAESLIEDQKHEHEATQNYARTTRKQIDDLKRELRLAMFQLSDTAIPKRIRKTTPKEDVEAHCPACGEAILYRQRASERSFKSVVCKYCDSKLVATFDSKKGFSLKPRRMEAANIVCGKCGTAQTFDVDNMPGISTNVTCSGCDAHLRVITTPRGHDIKVEKDATEILEPKSLVPEETIERVRRALPPQPWQSGIHNEIAERLGLPPKDVRRSITELIHRRVVSPQIDGVVYVPRDEPKQGS